MNILFDQTEAQAYFFNGAAEYAQTVFFKLLSELKNHPEVNIFSLYSSDRKFKYEQLSCTNLKKYSQVICIDYKNKSLKTIIEENKIDLLFITCAQSFCDLPLGNLENLGCKVVTIIHDFLDEEMNYSHILTFKYLSTPTKLLRFYMSRAKVRLLSGNFKQRRHLMLSMLENNNAEIITVSNYSKNSLLYNYPQLKNKIYIYYSPLKTVSKISNKISSKELKTLVENKTKFLLLLSADRVLKNAHSMINAFKHFCTATKTDMKIVTVGYKKKEYEEHICLPFLSASDLENAYKHCYALLYPSLFEGFGYPPLEAMKYGKPVLCSNVCSMPEVLEEAPIYFAPLYETDMFKALNEFTRTPYETLREKSLFQYNKVANKQMRHLNELSDKILNGFI